jgi:hypothetical protein
MNGKATTKKNCPKSKAGEPLLVFEIKKRKSLNPVIR